jgi:hypothetical protein
MRVGRPSLVRSEGGSELSAEVGGHRLFYRAPPGALTAERVEPFVAAAVMAAMTRRETLDFDPEVPVSPRMLAGVERAQDILQAWNPALRKVEVRARLGLAKRAQEGVALFFSGGVDGTYSLVKHEAEITHLVFIHGLEITLANRDLFRQALTRNEAAAERYGKILLPVETNLRELAAAHGLGNYLFQGAILAGVALALGFPRVYVGATFTYRDLHPWGTHPVLDPLWSTEATEIIHDGAEAHRTEKLARIAARPEALRFLRVCLGNSSEYNCGRCEKCWRTMLTLRLLGVRTDSFPPLSSVGRGPRIASEHERVFLADNLDLALRVGDREVARALRRSLWRYEFRQLVKLADSALADGRVRRAWRRLRGHPGKPEMIDPTPAS